MADADELSLSQSLKSLPQDLLALLAAHRFDANWLLEQARLSRSGQRSNHVTGTISAPVDEEIASSFDLSQTDEARFRNLGEAALREGKCALVVLAGGMATRMGGAIKALVEALPGKSFLDLRLAEQDTLTKKYGKRPPLWLMTSHATHEGIEQALAERLDGASLALFKQGLSVRLTPDFRNVFLDEDGRASVHAPGHGDLPASLQASGLLDDFVSAGGQYILVTNLDNLGGGLDPVLIGMHLASQQQVTCEVVDKLGSDRGGIPARLDGKLVVLEEFRIPPSFDPQSVPVFNVNSFAFDAAALAKLSMNWSYFEVHKKVDTAEVIQYERLINEVTFALPTQYVRVPRTGASSRFLPVKDYDELKSRQAELVALAKQRGMIA